MVDPTTFQRLHSAALTAQRRARAKYSNFHVGAAILTDTGRIVAGCNVENASFGLTMCAERVAIGTVMAEAAGEPLVCLVVGPKPELLAPCGACRQVLVEFNPNMVVILVSSDGKRQDTTIGALLPGAFDGNALK